MGKADFAVTECSGKEMRAARLRRRPETASPSTGAACNRRWHASNPESRCEPAAQSCAGRLASRLKIHLTKLGFQSAGRQRARLPADVLFRRATGRSQPDLICISDLSADRSAQHKPSWEEACRSPG